MPPKIDFTMGKKDAPASAMAESEEPTEIDAMQTFIDAVKAGDAESAHRAMESYKTLCEYSEAEPEMETFSG